ncbi:hypothetical protein DIPPA_04551 [Diplonema papillatum]|nr:hypothetical protein DIPPA_04551 [Diplonema papillatum]|eukprot:gene6853-10512_t
MRHPQRESNALIRHFVLPDGSLRIPGNVLRRALRPMGAGDALTCALRKQWPTSQLSGRQELVAKMARRQTSRSTFDGDYYHYSYEQYLGRKGSFEEAYKLLLKRAIHWTDLVFNVKDQPPLTDLKRALAQAGVRPLMSGQEEYECWLVALAYRAANLGTRAEWSAIEDDLKALSETWPKGRYSRRHSIVVAAYTVGFEPRKAVDRLLRMLDESLAFTPSACALLTSPKGFEYYLTNGSTADDSTTSTCNSLLGKDPAEDSTAANKAKRTPTLPSPLLGLHGMLVYYLRIKSSTMFWWTVRLYDEHSTAFGPLLPTSVRLIFLAWMHCQKTLCEDTLAALIRTLARHGLYKHAAAVATEIGKETRAGKKPGDAPQQRRWLSQASFRSIEEVLGKSLARGEAGAGGGESKDIAALRRAVAEAAGLAADGGEPPAERAEASVAPVEQEARVSEFFRLTGPAAVAALGKTRRTVRRRVRKIPRENVEAACVRELLRNAPFGGDSMVHKYVAVSNI